MGRITRTNFGITQKRTLTAAELIAAFAGGNVATVEMVPARSGVYYVPLCGGVRINWNADFGSVDAGSVCAFSVKDVSANANIPIDALPGNAASMDIFAQGASCLTMLGVDNNSTFWSTNAVPVLPLVDYANQPINFIIDNVAAGPFTLGGLTTVDLTVFYFAL